MSNSIAAAATARGLSTNAQGGQSIASPRATGVASLSRGPRSEKISDEHLHRRAIVYVRQSTQQQVLEHRESTARQYALVDRAVALGWPRSAVEVIDEDQGISGSSIEGRSGFQRLLTEVAADRVGVILGLEMSRLARSCKDWHALLELCSIYRTLLADADGLYDPSQYNDRLLLGLKGTMSEAELHILKSRLQQGMWNKAERGAVLNHPPIGYVRSVSATCICWRAFRDRVPPSYLPPASCCPRVSSTCPCIAIVLGKAAEARARRRQFVAAGSRRAASR